MGLLKRSREEEYGEVIDHIKIANYLMFLSHGVDVGFTPSVTTTSSHQYSSATRVFQCKTCSRQFPSFQALGGHRASHKRPRLMAMNAQTNSLSLEGSSSPQKRKTHECNICGVEFSIGQALGGHMRRHRAAPTTTESLVLQNASVKTSNSGKKNVLCMDLNLTPLENDVELRLGGQVIASMVG